VNLKAYAMKRLVEIDRWNIVEKEFRPRRHRDMESIFALGNGHMGQRANFEETYSGDSLQGNYLAGVYYPDKTRVGWWKNGYPEYFAKVINAPAWIGIRIRMEGEELDLARGTVEEFTRILHMHEGYLERKFRYTSPDGKKISAQVIRFLSITEPEAGAISYSLTPENFDGSMEIELGIDGDVRNEDANYREKFWESVHAEIKAPEAFLVMKTKKLGFHVCTGIHGEVFIGGKPCQASPRAVKKEKYVSLLYQCQVKRNQPVTVVKYGCQPTSLDHSPNQILEAAETVLKRCVKKGFDRMLAEQAEAWQRKWETSDIVIERDDEAQQGIRFNIFQLNQTYTGEDERLNIGPKGFTGEKYGGSTYWDTEAFCFPFYLSTSGQKVARNLLLYRYKHLQKAIENAGKLGFSGGAALYPMVTMNGEECHNEWEITFEEIHRNGAIAFAIYNYIRYTGDNQYLADYGLEVLIAISRFWSQRVNFSEPRQQYVILGVTGPNEYENNVNNNWYTNTIAVWCLSYTLSSLEYVRKEHPGKYRQLVEKTGFREKEETARWKEIIEKMYFPRDEEKGIFIQQDGYLDKEQMMADELDPAIRPLNQHWSWDRILRSCFIKQADVLQGLFFLEDQYDTETIRRNYDFYEPRTVHESSLSPCVHSVLAARIGYEQKAYELYLRTARLDLDDYNKEVAEGLHITSMAGTWMAIVLGFGGMRTRDGRICFHPMIPDKWNKYSFYVRFRESLLQVTVSRKDVVIANKSRAGVKISVYSQEEWLSANETKVFPVR